MAEKSQNADSGKEIKEKKINKKEKTTQQQKGLSTLSADLKKYVTHDKSRGRKVRRTDRLMNGQTNIELINSFLRSRYRTRMHAQRICIEIQQKRF